MSENVSKYTLPAQTLVAKRIQSAYPNLTEAQRRFATLVQISPLKVARLSIHDVVEFANVSVATANRFATALGFSGYTEFRAELIRGFEELFAPYDQLERKLETMDTPTAFLKGSLKEDIEDITCTAAAISEAEVEQAVTLIANAKRVYVAGFDLAAHLGGIFAINLSMIGCKATSASNGGGGIGAMRDIFDFTCDDVVVAIAFPHYYTDTLRISQYAHDAGIPVISVTDGPASPLASMSKTSLFVQTNHESRYVTSSAILSVLEGLVAAVATRRPDATETGRKFAEIAYPWMTNGSKGW
ncbi:MurR/RpiR family transcriptional regulator [Celeribacter sp.]|uniref:MurR/RpiR family transcriptional regulator n=1 Tax=Celeribacter sp. TaxID=1890673 RepID=UPI003A918040